MIFCKAAQVCLPSRRIRENLTASTGTKAGGLASLAGSARISSRPVRVLAGEFRCMVIIEPSRDSRKEMPADFKPFKPIAARILGTEKADPNGEAPLSSPSLELCDSKSTNLPALNHAK